MTTEDILYGQVLHSCSEPNINQFQFGITQAD